MQRETQWLIHSVPWGAHTLNFHCSVQSNFKCLKQKALLPLGGYCEISQIIFAFYMTASSFAIVHLTLFSLDIQQCSQTYQFQTAISSSWKHLFPFTVFSEERNCLKNICGDCILFISAGSASANRKGAWFCWILQGSITGVPQLLHYRRCIHWQKFI